MFSQRLIVQRQLVLDLIINASSNAYSATRGQPLHSGCDIHPVPVDPIPFHDHISEVDADPKLHPAIFREVGISGCKVALDLNGTLHRIHDTGKFGEQVITRAIDNPAMTLPNTPCHDLSIRGQGFHRRNFIIAHKAAVALDVGIEDCRELPGDPLRRHETSPIALPRIRKNPLPRLDKTSSVSAQLPPWPISRFSSTGAPYLS